MAKLHLGTGANGLFMVVSRVFVPLEFSEVTDYFNLPWGKGPAQL